MKAISIRDSDDFEIIKNDKNNNNDDDLLNIKR